MARFGRSRAATGDDDTEEWPDDPVPAPVTSRRPAPAAPDDDLPASRLRGSEITYGYAAGAVLVVAGVAMLAVTSGKGAPRHPDPLWAALALVFGLATVATIRWAHRLLTGFTAIAGGFVAEQAHTPDALAGVKLVALVIPFVYFFLLFRRYSKADRATRAPRSRGTRQAKGRAGAATGRGGKDAAPAARTITSARYTPPSGRQRRSRQT